MSDDATKTLVLSRRAKFVAMALAAAGAMASERVFADVPSGDSDAGEDAGDAGIDAEPSPCLCACAVIGKR